MCVEKVAVNWLCVPTVPLSFTFLNVIKLRLTPTAKVLIVALHTKLKWRHVGIF